MKLQTLTLESYRGFDRAHFAFDPQLTVIAGVNGAGKSSVLECIAGLLARWVPFFLEGHREDPATLAASDVRVGAIEATCTLHVSDPTREIIARYPNTNPTPLRSPGPPVSTFAARWREHQHLPTLFAFFYTVDRTLSGNEPIAEPGAAGRRPETEAERIARDVSEALTDALHPRGTRFEPFLAWFREREDLENEEHSRRRSFDYEDRQLGCVRRAIRGMLPGFSAPTVHRATRTLVVKKGGVELALNQLSDGERCLFAMVGDLARRLAQLDLWSDDPLQMSAVVLIDEIELHLHPQWQRTVLGRLRATFPNCQFVVTTHSPQVLSEAPTRSIVLLDDFSPHLPSVAVEGRDSNAILADVMGVAERPAPILERIRRVGDLIDHDHLAEAHAELDGLAAVVSRQDSEVVRLSALLEFLQGSDRAAHPEER
jgi:predicted ATP-binding protein involved in virulence